MWFDSIRNNRGIAILVTLSVITVIIAVALEVSRKVRLAVSTTAIARDKVTLSQMAISGMNAAIFLLVKDKNESKIDTIQEDWANPEKIKEVIDAIPFEDGGVSVIINDELSKIQVNALVASPNGRDFNPVQQILWDHFLNDYGSKYDIFEKVDTNEIINSLKDWLDSGDDEAITGLSGAESEYYEALEPPYPPRNGFLSHINEMLLVKGISKDLFYGVGEIKGISGVGEIKGISAYLTVFGRNTTGKSLTFEGKININTAALPVITALMPPGSEDLAQNIVEYRNETSDSQYVNDLSSPTWYKNPPGCSDLKFDKKLIMFSSDIFQIKSFAVLHETKVTIEAVIRREKKGKTGKYHCRVLSLQIL